MLELRASQEKQDIRIFMKISYICGNNMELLEVTTGFPTARFICNPPKGELCLFSKKLQQSHTSLLSALADKRCGGD